MTAGQEAMQRDHSDSELVELDWNFENVPDKELVACVLWEYARESAFIRDVRQRCIQNWNEGGGLDERLSADLSKIHGIGPFMEVLTRGVHCAPGERRISDMQRDTLVTNSFPAPWQTLPEDEREFRVRVLLSAGWYPATPFERAGTGDVRDIADQLEARWKEVYSEYYRVREAYPEESEVQLTAQGRLKPFQEFPVSILREEGKQVTAVAINWARFTNDEIVQWFRKWVKANRPKGVSRPDGKGRNKERDWRVALERLGMMRLLHRMTLGEIEAKFPKAWKFYEKREWYKERKRAGERFGGLFGCLDTTERPLCWVTKGGHSK